MELIRMQDARDVPFVRDDDMIVYAIKEEDNEIGYIGIIPDGSARDLCFMTKEVYRGQHLMRRAIGIMTRGLIDQGVSEIRATIPDDSEMAIHVVEHNGYAWQETDEGFRLYTYTQEETQSDEGYAVPEGCEVLYLANGCFWGGAKAFALLDGVVDTTVGYANGHTQHPRYEEVCAGDTGFIECVRVTYHPEITPLATLVEAYFLCVDPTVKDRQGNDVGHQYQAGIYYRHLKDAEELERIFAEKRKQYQPFCVELAPLQVFYEAEAYHQHYLDKHTNGYCHITPIEFEKVKALNQK